MVRRVLPRLTAPGPDSFRSPLHSRAVAARLSLWLGVAFAICFGTGLISHFMQSQPAWPHWPTEPVNLYRVTQGAHVAAGLATIPLLTAKVWTVYPKLFSRPLARNALHAAERGSLFVLVAGAVFELATGLINTARFYPWAYFFTSTHYWVGWITIGALAVHVAVKLPVTRTGLGEKVGAERTPGSLSRRGFLTSVAAAGGVVTLVTVGQTVAPLAPVALLAPRRPHTGPQGFPVNKAAVQAGVTDLARDPAWRLHVAGERDLRLSLADLRDLPQREVDLPIACVEGWSASARWRGVPVADLLDAVGIPEDARIRVESLQPHGLYRESELGPAHTRDRRTLLALDLDGQPLHLDHGFPCRLIAANRPGVLQTKWVTRISVLP